LANVKYLLIKKKTKITKHEMGAHPNKKISKKGVILHKKVPNPNVEH